MDEKLVFTAIRDLLEGQPHKIGEICTKLNLGQKEVLSVLKSNAYSFDYRIMRGFKVWISI